MFVIRNTILLSGILSLLLLVCVVSAETLEQELYEVDQLRAGFDTPFEEVEKRCNELLQRYTKPEEQGKIYFELAQVEGQSGLQRPSKAIEYAKKALELPQDPSRKVRLYGYWGSAIEVAHRGTHDEEMAKGRREAVIPYLQGLRQLQQKNLPKVKPDLPGVGKYDYSGPTDSELYRKLKRKNEEQLEARKLAKFQRDMIQHRDILTLQISGMYSRFPWASDEIRKLATKILKDETAVERLMSAVDAAVQQRKRELGWEAELLGNIVEAKAINEANDVIVDTTDTVIVDKTDTPVTSSPSEKSVSTVASSGLPKVAIGIGFVGLCVIAGALVWTWRKKQPVNS